MAAGTPGVDHPETKDAVDVRVPGHEEPLISFVEEADADSLRLTVGVDRSGRRVRLDVGQDVELVWKGPEGLRAIPAEIGSVVPSDPPCWRLRPVGPATRAQRREAVRAPLRLPVQVVLEGGSLTGETVDVSEGGLLAVFRMREGAPPRPHGGDPLQVTLTLDDPVGTPVACEAVARRVQLSEGTLELSVRFVGLDEKAGDRLRARVFTELRVLRARGVL
ncbi:flagellar brake protein [Geodermatophilus sp. SYSU D00758]